MTNQMFRRFIVVILFMGFSTLAEASPVVFTDLYNNGFKPIVLPYQANPLSYTYDINGNGYNPETDEILDATLSINFYVGSYDGYVNQDYEAADESELTIRLGEQITVIYQTSPGWWLVYNPNNGEAGVIRKGEAGVSPVYFDILDNVETSASFQLSFDGQAQSINTMPLFSSVSYEYAVPVADLIDGRLNLDVRWVEVGAAFASEVVVPEEAVLASEVVVPEGAAFAFESASLRVTVERTLLVPEPTTGIMLILGMAALLLRRQFVTS